MTHTAPTPDDHHPRRWLILIAVGLTLFMGAIDGSIVNVAMPSLVVELNTNFRTIQWLALAFLVGLTMTMLSMGRLGDMIGKKRVFTLGLVIFVLGSMLCGLAGSVYWLIAFRFLQSLGAAMSLALGVAIITETWPAHQRGKAIGIAGGIISIGIAAGPALGGLILHTLNWRWIFFVNLPIGLISLALVLAFVPPLRPSQRAERFDFAGALLIGCALLSFALAMSLTQSQGLRSWPVLGLLTLFVAGLVAFLAVERRSPQPMIDLTLFRNRVFSLNLLTGSFTFIAISGVVLLLPFYLQLVMGLEQRSVGLLMAVVPVVLSILGPIAGSLSDRLGTRPVSLVGLALIMTGYLLLTRLGVASTPLHFVLLLAPVGMGMGVFQSPNNTAIMSAAPRSRLGVASGILSMTRTLGQLVGIALLGAFFAGRLAVHAQAPVDVTAAAPAAIVAALHDQLYLVAIMIGAGLILALWQARNEGNARRNEAQKPP
jgi:EmrB/QacA subfamily drug resistance transporter